LFTFRLYLTAREGRYYRERERERERAENNWVGRQSGLLQGTVVGSACRDRENTQRASFEVSSPADDIGR
jgi:predicted transposase YdaD